MSIWGGQDIEGERNSPTDELAFRIANSGEFEWEVGTEIGNPQRVPSTANNYYITVVSISSYDNDTWDGTVTRFITISDSAQLGRLLGEAVGGGLGVLSLILVAIVFGYRRYRRIRQMGGLSLEDDCEAGVNAFALKPAKQYRAC